MKKFVKAMLVVAVMLVFSLPLLLSGCAKGNLEDLKIHTNFKTEYFVGESLDVTNGKLLYTNKEGKETVVSVQENMITSFSTTTEGEREMVITYNGLTLTISYSVTKLYDVTVGDLYYSTPSIFTPTPSNYDYIYIYALNKITISSSNATPANYQPTEQTLQNSTFTFNRTIENKKVIYTYSVNSGNLSATYKIIVENENQLTVSISGTDPVYGEVNSSSLFTKYVK